MKKTILSAVFSVLVISLLAVPGDAQDDREYRKELRNAAARVDSATEVFEEIMRIDDNSIPKDILAKAYAVVVFPGTLKGAFILGASGGKGVAIRKIERNWSAPAFVNIGGASFGFQIGGQKTDYILVIMNAEGLEGLLEDEFEIGGEASVAAGPVGRTTGASTNATFDASILTYSRSQGAFAGVSLKGAVIKQDKSINQTIYGKSAKELLIRDEALWETAPAELQLFSKTVARFVR